MGRANSVVAIAAALTVAWVAALAEGQNRPSIEPVRVLTGEWPPIASQAFYAPFLSYGRAADVVVSALRAAGYETRLGFDSFGQAYARARDGRADAAFPYYETPARAREMAFSDPLLEVTEVVFYDRKHAPELGRVQSLADMGQVLGQAHGRSFREHARFVEDYCYSRELEAAFERDCTGGDWRDIPTEVAAFRALLDDRNVLVLPSAREVGERILRTWFTDEERQRVGIVAGLQWPRDVYLLARRGRDGDRLIERFNRGLAQLRQSGEYEDLVNAPLPEESILRTVRLSDPGTFPLVVARKERGADETVVLPRGTRAKVVQWSPNFLTPKTTTLQEQLNQMSRVLIMNGPQRGQLLWVKNVFIELD